MPLIIGLTGGVACGKTTVSELFRALGATVLDADESSRALTGPGGAALPLIARHLGPELVGPDGLDRARTRDLVFRDPLARRRLEGVIHPLVRSALLFSLARLPESQPYVLLSVPLLLEHESSWRPLIRRLLVVDAAPERQLERLLRERDLSEETARAIIAAQVSRERRRAAADDLLENDGDRAALGPAVAALHRRYLELSQDAGA